MDIFGPIFSGLRLEWEVNLPPEKVHQTLSQIPADSEWWTDPLIGDFREDGFVLTRAPGLHRNAKHLRGTISPTVVGSKITARFRLSWSAALLIGSLIFLLFLLPLLAISVALRSGRGEDMALAMFSLLFPMLGLLILRNLSRSYRAHEEIIAEFMNQKMKPFQRNPGTWYPIL